MLAHKKGVRNVTITRFLRVGPQYLARLKSAYQARGIDWFGKHGHKGLRRYEMEPNKKAVFTILHAPPSAYGINRTTWTIKLIGKVMSKQGMLIGKNDLGKIIRNAGYRFCKAKKYLTSNDPDYMEKVAQITNILSNLKSDEKFFSVDEFGPFAVKMQGGWSYMKQEDVKIVPIIQKSKGTLIVTAALELSENQVVHFYSAKKNTSEMLKMLEMLLVRYADQACLYFSWDAASWHASKELYKRVDEINSPEWGCKSLSVNCLSSLRLHPFGVRRSEGERSEPSAAEPRRGGGAPRAKNWSRAGQTGFLLGCQRNTSNSKPK